MSKSVETSVAQIGLRDLLFYVLPGSVILLGVAGLTGVQSENLMAYAGLAPSVAGLLSAYLLGQCVYPLGYLIRLVMERTQRIEKSRPLFRCAYRLSPEIAPTFFTVEIFRYRTLARFCSVMVCPVLFAAISIAWGEWHLPCEWQWGAFALGLVTALGFLLRYWRYERRYRRAVMELADAPMC